MYKKVLATFFLGLSISLISAQALARFSLEGRWQHDGMPTTIRTEGRGQYLFCNEDNNCAKGYQLGENRVSVPSWKVTGVYYHDSIRWSNGTTWVRSFTPHSRTSAISGTWYHSNRPTSISVSRDGASFVLTNEYGQTSQGYFRDGRELVLPSLKVTGRINRHLDRIEWSNNTVWHR